MELTLLDLEKLTVSSKRFYHWLEQEDDEPKKHSE